MPTSSCGDAGDLPSVNACSLSVTVRPLGCGSTSHDNAARDGDPSCGGDGESYIVARDDERDGERLASAIDGGKGCGIVDASCARSPRTAAKARSMGSSCGGGGVEMGVWRGRGGRQRQDRVGAVGKVYL